MRTKLFALLIASSGVLTVLPPSCHPAASPDSGVDGGITPQGAADAGQQTVSGICYFIEGIDPSAGVLNMCATIEEILSGIAFILTLRNAPGASADAGTGVCQVLPQTTFCATSLERYKLIKYIVTLRGARLVLDAGK